MDRVQRPRRQQVLEYVRRLGPEEPEILQLGAMSLTVELGDAPEQPLQRDDVPAGMGQGVLQCERPVAGAKLQFQRLLRREQRGQVDRLDGRSDRVNQRLARRQ